MNSRMYLYAVVGVLAVVVLATCAMADPPSWSSFVPASFDGIHVTPSLTQNSLDYTISLDAYPKITLGATTYDVNWVQAFFVVSQDQATGFVATNGSVVTDWTWEEKQNPGRIAGWHGEGSNRIYPGGSKEIGFQEFDVTGNTVLSGFHIGYQNGSSEVTNWYKGDAPPVPEPSSLIALLTGFIGCGYLLRRRAS